MGRRAALAGALALLAAPLGSCSTGDTASDVEAYTGSTFAFDTYCTFTVYGDQAAPAALAEACARYDALLDLYDPESDIARVNAAGGAPVEVDPATFDCVSRAVQLAEQLDGLFDPTIGAVSTLWDFEQGTRPTDEEVAEGLSHVGWRLVGLAGGETNHPVITLGDPLARLDLGAIAKGYVADRLVELLQRETDAAAAAISLGGNIIYHGKKPGGGAWETGIRDPNDPGGSDVLGIAETGAISLVTSGLYERTFELDGRTYWHVLDPKTGMPVETDALSVTVARPTSTEADALSTALFVAGSERGLSIADSFEDTGAYFALADGSSRASSRWDELTSFTPA